jgi:hypothetical protein
MSALGDHDNNKRASAVPGVCKSCGGAVILARSPRFWSYIALDAEPSPDGTLLVERGHARRVPTAKLAELREEGRLHRPHAGSCPDAAGVRKRLREDAERALAHARTVATTGDGGASNELEADERSSAS